METKTHAPGENLSQTTGSPSTEPRFQPSGQKIPVVKYVIFALLLLLVGGGLFVLSSAEYRGWLLGSSDEDFSKFVTKPVELDAFKVTVEAKGTVDSSRNSSLTSNVEGQTTIISIVPAGTMVIEPLRAKTSGVVKEIRNLSSRTPTIVVVDEEGEETEHDYEMSVYSEVLVEVGDTVEYDEIMIGDLVCELDASTLVDAEKQQQINVEQADADLEKGIKNVEIQIAQNESDISTAKLTQKLAELDLKKYQQGEYIQEKERIEGEIEQAREDLKLAEESLEFTRRVARKGYKSPDDVEVEKIKVLKAQLQLNVSLKELEVLENFTKERTIAELLEKAAESKRELTRVKLQGEAALAQFEAEVSSRRLSYNVQKSQLDRLRDQIEACKLIAPQAGQVVYKNETSRRSEPTVIEEGATVRERQTIINLPDMSAMKVDARIHESKISDVVEDLPVIIRVDAIPNHVYTGVLETVSSVPLPGSWPNYDLKQYEAVVRILDQGEMLNQLKPGLSANIEIIVEESAEKKLQVPVQAAVDIGPSYYAWVLSEEGVDRRKVKLGRSNDVKFVVEEGLKEGEEVILNPRTHFAEEIAKLEAEAIEKNRQERGRFDDGEDDEPLAENGESKDSRRSGAPPDRSSTADAQQSPAEGPRRKPAELFAQRDANGDGELSEAEIPDKMKERLDGMDSDGNGRLSKSEFMAAMKKYSGQKNSGQPGQTSGATRGAE